MDESKVEKREYGFLWNIIGAYLLLIAINVGIKTYVVDNALTVSVISMSAIGILLTVLYAVKLKAVLNQILVFLVCIGFTLGSMIPYIYDLACKNTVGFISLPLFLVLCGMWIYTKFSKTEIK